MTSLASKGTFVPVKLIWSETLRSEINDCLLVLETDHMSEYVSVSVADSSSQVFFLAVYSGSSFLKLHMTQRSTNCPANRFNSRSFEVVQIKIVTIRWWSFRSKSPYWWFGSSSFLRLEHAPVNDRNELYSIWIGCPMRCLLCRTYQ